MNFSLSSRSPLPQLGSLAEKPIRRTGLPKQGNAHANAKRARECSRALSPFSFGTRCLRGACGLHGVDPGGNAALERLERFLRRRHEEFAELGDLAHIGVEGRLREV